MKKNILLCFALGTILSVTSCGGGGGTKKSIYAIDECESMVSYYSEKYGTQGFRWVMPKVDSFAGTEYNLQVATLVFQRSQEFSDEGKVNGVTYSVIITTGSIDDVSLQWMSGYTVSYTLANEETCKTYNTNGSLNKWKGRSNNNTIESVTFKDEEVDKVTFTSDSKNTAEGESTVKYLIKVVSLYLASESFSLDIFK